MADHNLVLNAHELADVDYLAWRLGPTAPLCDLPVEPLELFLWVASGYRDWATL